MKILEVLFSYSHIHLNPHIFRYLGLLECKFLRFNQPQYMWIEVNTRVHKQGLRKMRLLNQPLRWRMCGQNEYNHGEVLLYRVSLVLIFNVGWCPQPGVAFSSIFVNNCFVTKADLSSVKKKLLLYILRCRLFPAGRKQGTLHKDSLHLDTCVRAVPQICIPLASAYIV